MATEKLALPRGAKFFELVAHAETQGSGEALVEIRKLGVSTPGWLEALGDVL